MSVPPLAMPAAGLANPAHVSRRATLVAAVLARDGVLHPAGAVLRRAVGAASEPDPGARSREQGTQPRHPVCHHLGVQHHHHADRRRVVRPHPHALRQAHTVDRGGLAGRRHLADDLLADADALDHHLFLGAGGRVAQFDAGRADHHHRGSLSREGEGHGLGIRRRRHDLGRNHRHRAGRLHGFDAHAGVRIVRRADRGRVPGLRVVESRAARRARGARTLAAPARSSRASG